MGKKRAGWTFIDSESASDYALRIKDALKSNILGQDKVIGPIADCIEIRQAKFQEEDKPIYKGLYMGPSGVGKTLVAEMLSLAIVGKKTGFTRIACEAYSESHSISKLIGAPPGYLGHIVPGSHGNNSPILSQENIDKWAISANQNARKIRESLEEARSNLEDLENGIFQLLYKKYFGIAPDADGSEADNIDRIVRLLIDRRARLLNKIDALESRSGEIAVDEPVSIILFDEIEKAHPTLHNIILNVLDKAVLTMANGAVTSFKNSIILATSNVNSRVIADLVSKKRKLGFNIKDEADLNNIDRLIYEKSMEAARREFSPEFLPRFDDIRVFRPLSEDTLWKIFNLELSKFEDKYLDPVFVKLELDDEVKRFIVNEATDKPENGARLLKQKVDKYLKRQIARLKNRGELMGGDIIHVVLADDGKTLEFYRESPLDAPHPQGEPTV